MLKRAAAVLAVLSLVAPALCPVRAEEKKKGKKPALEIRPSPRFAFSPANIFFTAELKGGDDLQELYCPEVEWEWDDGGKSIKEADCPPFVAGETKIERRFTAEHEFRLAATYNVKISLKRLGKSFAVQTLRLTVRPGAGDPAIEDN